MFIEYSLVAQNLAPTDDTLKVISLSFFNNSFLSLMGSALIAGTRYSKIGFPLSQMVRTPFRMGAWKLRMMFSAFSRSLILNVVCRDFLTNQLFWTVNGVMVSRTLALVVSKMLILGKSKSRTLSTGSSVPTSSLSSSTRS